MVLFLSASCEKAIVQPPAQLVEKGKMIDIMYDLALLEAMRYQNPASLDSIDISSKKFVLKKYKVDSLQFAKSNMYYAADYANYKEMFDEIAKRLEKNQKVVDSALKIEEKKAAKTAKKNPKEIARDSVKKPFIKINIDSIKAVKRLERKKAN